MTTNQEARHQDLRDSTSTARGMTADWHALWDGASVADGTFNERLLAWINAELGTSYTNLPGAMHAYAADGGFANWHSINVIESGPTYAVNSNEPDTVADFAGVLNSGTPYFRVGGTETTFASMFSFSRASAGYYLNSSGVWTSASSGTARTGHYKWNGSSWVRAGILLESTAATNLLLNSNTLSTQGVSVTAQAYTLSFSGTGTVTLSGASTAGPLVGTGTGEQNRVRLTFTPSAGTLTLTVSGTVSNAQLEAGSVPTSYIPTTGATATRAAETLTIAAANMAYSATAMSFHMQGEISRADSGIDILLGNWQLVSPANWVSIGVSDVSVRNGRPLMRSRYNNGTGHVDEYTTDDVLAGINVEYNLAGRINASTQELEIASGGVATGTPTTIDATMPDVSGSDFTFANAGSVTIALFRQADVDWTDAGIEEATS